MLAAGDEVEGIAFPEAAQAVNDYPLAVLTAAPNRRAAEAFVALRPLAGRASRSCADAGFERA